MLSQLAQWQQSRKVFFLRATHQQWNEVSAEEHDPLQRPFQKLLAFQMPDTVGQVTSEQQRCSCPGPANRAGFVPSPPRHQQLLRNPQLNGRNGEHPQWEIYIFPTEWTPIVVKFS